MRSDCLASETMCLYILCVQVLLEASDVSVFV